MPVKSLAEKHLDENRWFVEEERRNGRLLSLCNWKSFYDEGPWHINVFCRTQLGENYHATHWETHLKIMYFFYLHPTSVYFQIRDRFEICFVKDWAYIFTANMLMTIHKPQATLRNPKNCFLTVGGCNFCWKKPVQVSMLRSWYQVIYQWYCWWKKCCLSHDLQGFIHPWWCRSSSINSIIHSFLELNHGVVLNVKGLLNLDMLSFQSACRSLLQEVWKGKDHLSLKHIYNVLAYRCLLRLPYSYIPLIPPNLMVQKSGSPPDISEPSTVSPWKLLFSAPLHASVRVHFWNVGPSHFFQHQPILKPIKWRGWEPRSLV